MKEFQEDVGMKLDIGFASSSLRYECWKWPTDSYHEVFGQAGRPFSWRETMLKCHSPREPHNESMSLEEQLEKHRKEGKRWLHTTSPLFVSFIQSILEDYTPSRNATAKSSLPAPPKLVPSTGMITLVAAMMVCDSVDMYGFGERDNYHHYFQISPGSHKPWTGHNFDVEHQFFLDVIQGRGRYLDRLKLYDLAQKVTFKDFELH